MKFIIFLFIAIATNYTAFSQSKSATYCGRTCARLTIQVEKRTNSGVANSSVFEISNNLPGKVKVKLFVKRKDGEWKDLGTSEPIEQGKSTTYNYNQDNLTGEYCAYYINYPSEEKFPYESDVKKRMNHGYGN